MELVKSKERAGFDALLSHFPDADVRKVTVNETWLLIVFGSGERFAIWRSTGNVYVWNTDGSVDDDPIIAA